PDHIQSEVPAFRALTRQILPVDNLQAAGNEMGLVVVHRFEFNEHSAIDGFDKLAFLGGGKAGFLEPVRKREDTAGFQKPCGVDKETTMIVIVGDGLDRPKKV